MSSSRIAWGLCLVGLLGVVCQGADLDTSEDEVPLTPVVPGTFTTEEGTFTTEDEVVPGDLSSDDEETGDDNPKPVPTPSPRRVTMLKKVNRV